MREIVITVSIAPKSQGTRKLMWSMDPLCHGLSNFPTFNLSSLLVSKWFKPLVGAGTVFRGGRPRVGYLYSIFLPVVYFTNGSFNVPPMFCCKSLTFQSGGNEKPSSNLKAECLGQKLSQKMTLWSFCLHVPSSWQMWTYLGSTLEILLGWKPTYDPGKVAVSFCLAERLIQTWIINPGILLGGHSSFPGAPVIFIL